MGASVIVVVVEVELRVVTLEDEILARQIGYSDVLAAGAKDRIQPAVGIFIELLEICGIVFVLVLVVVAEEANSRLLI